MYVEWMGMVANLCQSSVSPVFVGQQLRQKSMVCLFYFISNLWLCASVCHMYYTDGISTDFFCMFIPVSLTPLLPSSCLGVLSSVDVAGVRGRSGGVNVR